MANKPSFTTEIALDQLLAKPAGAERTRTNALANCGRPGAVAEWTERVRAREGLSGALAGEAIGATMEIRTDRKSIFAAAGFVLVSVNDTARLTELYKAADLNLPRTSQARQVGRPSLDVLRQFAATQLGDDGSRQLLRGVTCPELEDLFEAGVVPFCVSGEEPRKSIERRHAINELAQRCTGHDLDADYRLHALELFDEAGRGKRDEAWAEQLPPDCRSSPAELRLHTAVQCWNDPRELTSAEFATMQALAYAGFVMLRGDAVAGMRNSNLESASPTTAELHAWSGGRAPSLTRLEADALLLLDLASKGCGVADVSAPERLAALRADLGLDVEKQPAAAEVDMDA